MPEAKTPSPTLPATLELASSVRLAGSLCLLDDGKLQLSSTRVLDDVDQSGTFVMPSERAATLNLGALRDRAGFIDNVDVTVSGASGTTLKLTLRNQEGELEKRCLILLPGYRKETDAAGEDDDLSTDLPEDNLQLLKQQSIKRFEKLLKQFLVELCQHLQTLSTKTKQVTSGENIHYEAMNAIKKNGMDIIAAASGKIEEYYQDLTPGKKPEPKTPRYKQRASQLDLVDLKEFEDNLAVGRMISIGENLYSIKLECLIIRLAEIIGSDPHTVRLPVHVSQLCRAFQQATEGQDIPKSAIPDQEVHSSN